MKRLNYKLEQTAQGLMLCSEDGTESIEITSLEAGGEKISDLNNADKITFESAEKILSELIDAANQMKIPIADDLKIGEGPDFIDGMILKENLSGLTITLKWKNLFEKAGEGPVLVMCTCGNHGRIKVNEEEFANDITSKEDAKRWIPILLEKKKIDKAGVFKLLDEIEKSNLPETEEVGGNEGNNVSISSPFPGMLMVEIRG